MSETLEKTLFGIETQYVHSLEETIVWMSDRVPRILSRIPIVEIRNRAAKTKAGAFDFDGTLVTGSQWKTVDALLPAELQAEQEATRSWYFSHVHNGNGPRVPITDPDWFHGTLLKGNRLVAEGAWIAESFRIHGKAGITQRLIEQAGQGITPREGALDLLQLFNPRVIISFGIEQVIQAWADHHGVTSAVAASRLRFDANGVISGCHINLVASETKEFAANLFRERTGVHEEELFVVGDSIVDLAMMQPCNFNVLIIPPGELDKRMTDFRDNNLVAMWDRLTLILVCDSLKPLVTLIQTARQLD